MGDTKKTVSNTATQHLAELQSNARTVAGFGAGSYGSDLQSAFVDPSTGQQVSGMGFVPLADGTTKTIGDLILGARTPKNLTKIRSALINNGLISKNVKSIGSVQSAWQQVVIGASTAQMDPFDYMKQLRQGGFGQDTSATGAANLPQRQIYQYTEADRQKIIDDVSQKLRGQGITEEDKQAEWYKGLQSSINNMINTGTVTTTKEVRNPKTGKLENKSVTTPGFSQEKAAAVAEQAIRKATPEDVARQDRVGFTSWMFNQLGVSNG